ncbi:alpha-L-fucosidase [Paenibacillus sp. FSL H7-0714]|uniref:alpha-L-fucosidase n=1 Tax=Paenibacillus sp. FSL H7-0714 TaxID=2954735 RepID=UPI0030F73E78
MMQEWFKKSKLGIFITWGIYAVKGIPESWSIATGEISYDDYMSQLNGFTASQYDPKKWARLFKLSGANYAVLTAKHHDGVALFDTRYTDLNVVKSSPAGEDLVKPYCEAMREAGLKVGLYFTNTDWADLDHFSVVLDKTPEELAQLHKVKTEYRKIWRELRGSESRLSDDVIVGTPVHKEAWARFLERYKGEIRELLTQYGDIDLMYFDVMLERRGYPWNAKEVREMIDELSPNTVINSRLQGYGDYETPEMYIPLTPIHNPWELSTTFNNSWGFRFDDNNYKDIHQIVRMLCECITKGGNMLISLGPDESGEINADYEERLIQLGQWTSKYAEAIYPTERGIEPEYFLGGSTLSEDKKVLYLFVYDRPHKYVMLNGIRSSIKKITSLANGAELKHRIIGGAVWLNLPGSIWIELDEKDQDDVCTVIKVEFDGEIDLVALHSSANSGGEN